MGTLTRNIPNAITCLNILAGTLAILAAIHASETFAGLSGLQWAWILTGVAAVADFCDGLAARALKAYSDLGKELDSLCDLVSFGVAPAVMLHQCLMLYGGLTWMAWCAPLIAIGGALRLARFNTAPENNVFFTGLPIPANAIFWIGFTAFYAELQVISPWFTLVSIIGCSLLMVSPLHLFTLKFKHWGLKGNLHRWALIAAVILLVALTGVPGLMWSIIFYVALSLALTTSCKKQ